MREISSRWRKLTPEEKHPYQVEAAKDKERYDQEKKLYLESKPVDATPIKKTKRSEPKVKEGTRTIKVRLQGEDIFDQLTIHNSMTVKQLYKKIQQKRSDHRPIISLIQLPNVRIRDQADINSLVEGDTLEFQFGEFPQT